MTLWPGRSAGWALPAKTTWIGRSGVPQQPGQPVDVGEEQRRRACRSRTGGRSRSSGSPGRAPSRARPGPTAPRRAGRTGCAAGRGRRCASSRFWRRWASHRSRARDAVEALPEAVLPACRRRGRRGRRRGGARAGSAIGAPTQVGPWTPLVMPRISWSMTSVPRRVRGLGVELADRVRAVGQAQARRPSCRTGTRRRRRRARARGRSSIGHAAGVEQGAGDAADEVGVEPLVAGRDRRVDREHAVAPDARPGVVERGARPPRTRGRARRAGTPSGPR